MGWPVFPLAFDAQNCSLEFQGGKHAGRGNNELGQAETFPSLQPFLTVQVSFQ